MTSSHSIPSGPSPYVSNYDKAPSVQVPGYARHAFAGYAAIGQALRASIARVAHDRRPIIVAVDCYPGVNDGEVLTELQCLLEPDVIVDTLTCRRPEAAVRALIDRHLTDDPVFGVLCCHDLSEFFDRDKLDEAARTAHRARRLALVYGVGAALVTEADVLVYADLARWPIQQRMRAGMGNWGADNGAEDLGRRYKRGYFVDWRVADRHKKKLLQRLDFLLDTNTEERPTMVSGAAFLAGLRETARRPFRLVPYFDPAPWGGQWMKSVCDLDRNERNFGWCFDCVPEENSLLLCYGDVTVQVPAIDLVFAEPVALLGERVHARFGTEFPIRFDFLDTMGGGNLSLQVHPLTEYIQETFGMHYTQDESYYLLDAEDDATVYLGVKEGIRPQAMMAALRRAAADSRAPFDAERFINRFPAKKHDHFLIPAGTCHCSGKGSMVLEISATPYIFTFKLWDWGRLGLNGKPRPIHLDHGERVIQWQRDTAWVTRELVNRCTGVAQGDGWREERTGLHEREFIETRRVWFTAPVGHDTNGTVNVLNLVDGRAAVVESPVGAFAPFEVHYAETFVVPAAVGAYVVKPQGTLCATIKATVRT